MRLRLLRCLVPLAAALGAAGLLACGGSEDSDVFLADIVAVTLTDSDITLDDLTTPDGLVQFDVTNAGTQAHDLLIVFRGTAASLPTLPDGSYEENAGGTTVVEAVQDIAPGATVQVTVELVPGGYVLLCNDVTGGASHFALGMSAGLNVS